MSIFSATWSLLAHYSSAFSFSQTWFWQSRKCSVNLGRSTSPPRSESGGCANHSKTLASKSCAPPKSVMPLGLCVCFNDVKMEPVKLFGGEKEGGKKRVHAAHPTRQACLNGLPHVCLETLRGARYVQQLWYLRTQTHSAPPLLDPKQIRTCTVHIQTWPVATVHLRLTMWNSANGLPDLQSCGSISSSSCCCACVRPSSWSASAGSWRS